MNISGLFTFPALLLMFNETPTSHHLQHMSGENSLFYDCTLLRGPIYKRIPHISFENIFPFYFPAKSNLHFSCYIAMKKDSSLPSGAEMHPSACREKKKKTFKCDYFDKNTFSACLSLSLVGYSSTLFPSTVRLYICSIYNRHNSCCTGINPTQTINML